MEKWTVDRIEEEYIVLEKDSIVTSIKKDEIIGNIKEGDVLVKKKEGKFVLDKEASEDRKVYIENLTKDLWEN